MNSYVFRIILMSFFLSGCATWINVPTLSKRKDIVKNHNKIYVAGITSKDISVLNRRSSEVVFVDLASQNPAPNGNHQVCALVESRHLDRSNFQTIVSILTLTMYPLESSEEIVVKTSKCDGSGASSLQRPIEIIRLQGILAPVFPEFAIDSYEAKMDAIRIVILNDLSRLI